MFCSPDTRVVHKRNRLRNRLRFLFTVFVHELQVFSFRAEKKIGNGKTPLRKVGGESIDKGACDVDPGRGLERLEARRRVDLADGKV